MKPSFILTRNAALDIDHIFEYGLLKFGRSRADRYIRELNSILTLISENPQIARVRHEITPPIRVHPFNAHVIVYTLKDTNVPLILGVKSSRSAWVDDRY
jgi:toxin ParE1/3/4